MSDRSTVVAMGDLTGHVWDPALGSFLLTSKSGYLREWSATTLTTTKQVYVGGELYGVSLVPNTNDILIADEHISAKPGTPHPVWWDDRYDTVVHRISLTDFTTTDLHFEVQGYDRGPFDVAVAADSTALLDFSAQMHPAGLFAAETSITNPPLSPITGANFYPPTGDLFLSESGRYVLITPEGISNGPLAIYDSVTQRITASTDLYALNTSGFNDGHADINDSAGLVVSVTYGELLVYDLTLALVKDLSRQFSQGQIVGAHFLQGGHQLALWDSYSSSILLYDTSTWRQVGAVPVQTTVSGIGATLPQGQMDLGDHGTLLWLQTPNGFEVVDLAAKMQLFVEGTDSADHLFGAFGPDTLTGGSGADTLTGGDGADVFNYSSVLDSTSATPDFISDFQTGLDKINLSRVSPQHVSVTYSGGVSTVVADTATGQLVIKAQGVVDLLHDVVTHDFIGSSGSDTLIGASPGDTLTGQGGSDVFRIASSAASPLSNPDVVTDFTSGSDKLDLSSLAPTAISIVARAGGEDVTAVTPQGQVQIEVHGTLQPADIVTGNVSLGFAYVAGSGDDAVVGGAGPDTLSGAAGDDTLTGGAANDTLDGGAGYDTAVIGSTRAATTIVQTDASTYVLTGPDGVDTLHDIEVFSFSDGVIYPHKIEGTYGDDTLTGRLGNDTVLGYAGNDTIVGSEGANTINGGDGLDTLKLAGFGHDYRAFISGGAGSIAGGPEHLNDVLTSVEALQFLDGTLTFDTGSTAAQILRLYDSFLGRAPDAAGFQSYLRFVQAGHSFQDMAANAAASPEFANATAALTDEQYITYVYEHSLHREPDAYGLQQYEQALHDGTLTRASMIVQAAESPEHVALTSGVVAQGLWVPDEKVESLELLYDAAVQRQPDATGIAGYSAEIDSNTTYRQIANQMASSAEFQTPHAGQDDRAYIDSLYVAEVGRHADPSGMAAYLDQLAHGYTRGDILWETAFSAEHQSHVLAFYDPLLS